MSAVKVVADSGVRGSGLDVGAASDIVNLGQRNSVELSACIQRGQVVFLLVEVTSKIDGTDNGLELGEASDGGQLSVVGQNETTTNLSQRREGEIAQVRTIDESDGATGLSKVGERGHGEQV